MLIYTDGSCRRNGKPDCVAGFGVYASNGVAICGYETASTSQRGELFAMQHALSHALEQFKAGYDDTIYIVSDSAYIVNCIREEWYTKWARTGWVTSTGSSVKNQDIWETIVSILTELSDYEIMFYLIKGHITEKKLQEGMLKFADYNFGAVPPVEVFREMVAGNNMVDAIAKQGRDTGEEKYTGLQRETRHFDVVQVVQGHI